MKIQLACSLALLLAACATSSAEARYPAPTPVTDARAVEAPGDVGTSPEASPESTDEAAGDDAAVPDEPAAEEAAAEGTEDAPTSAPPAPRYMNPGQRHGYVWIRGRHEWRGREWVWTAGHWERAKAGHRWVDGSWERRGATYHWVPGRWEPER